MLIKDIHIGQLVGLPRYNRKSRRYFVTNRMIMGIVKCSEDHRFPLCHYCNGTKAKLNSNRVVCTAALDQPINTNKKGLICNV